MRNRQFKREMRDVSRLALGELFKKAQRNKRLKRNALECRFRTAYAQRKMLAQAYGRAIAARLREAQ